MQIWGDYSGVGVYPDDYSERKRQSMKSTCCDQGRGYAGKDVLVERIALGSGAKKKKGDTLLQVLANTCEGLM